MSCIFCRIAAGELPAKVVRQDEHCLVIHDIAPKAPVHLLVVPRKHVASLADAADEDRDLLGRLLLAARDAARDAGIDRQGYRLIANTREHGGQEVPHLHLHVLGGARLGAMVGR